MTDRRRLFLMRHAEVSYFGPDGLPVNPLEVSLNEEGVAQAQAAAGALAGVAFDRVITSGLPRTLETARIVARDHEVESWPELTEIQGGRLSEIPPDALEREFVHAFRGVIPNDARFLRGESIGELFDRVLPGLERLVADPSWGTALAVLHGGVNRAILSYALTGERMFLGHFEQAPACVNVLDLGEDGEWIVRAVNVSAYDLLHLSHRQTTMERYWEQYRRGSAS
ncbi:MAG TPA: histidine phosphatase family protein [Gaiellaceae bacterium]|nr:histidine phosphatase family protein [Gaiellaceae bacterium]